MHHIRPLKGLWCWGPVEKPEWIKKMAARQRKMLVVCRRCQEDIHAGRRTRPAPCDVVPDTSTRS